MDFMKSQTLHNLCRSVAGEAQANLRYTAYAEVARTQNMEYLARIFETTAGNEQIHGKELLEQIKKNTNAPLSNYGIEAGYPYDLGNTVENLLFASQGEKEECENIYPEFSKIAREEGFVDIAQLWTLLSKVEGEHETIYAQAHQQLTDGSLYKKEKPTVWRCLNCGHVITALEPWDTCPICHKPKGWVMGKIDMTPDQAQSK